MVLANERDAREMLGDVTRRWRQGGAVHARGSADANSATHPCHLSYVSHMQKCTVTAPSAPPLYLTTTYHTSPISPHLQKCTANALATLRASGLSHVPVVQG